MQKAKVYNIADSNIANLGSDLEKAVKLESAKTEPAWQGAGQAVGLQIWRIEKFKVVAVRKETYGQFFSGDSYIVLHTYKPNPQGDKIAWDIHFWLGTYTSQDEAGTAAYKTVELDTFLGGAPVQYREVQSYESQRFLALFPKGIRIQEGGVDTGFTHVKAAEYRPRLLQVKGKRLVRVQEVPLSHKSMNSGDVFIFDGGLDIIQWNGSKAGAMEKTKAAQLLQAMESERLGKAHGRVIDEKDDDEAFFKGIGGKGEIKSAEAGGLDDIDVDLTQIQKRLFRLSDASGNMTFKEEAKGKKFDKKALDSNDVFILDAGAEVIAWVGSKASAEEKKYALKYAQEYVIKEGKNPATSVSRCIEGGENPVFKSFFNAV